MKALISTIEPRETGYRVAQVESDDSVFGVAEGLFWTTCPDNIKQDEFWFDPSTNTFVEVVGFNVPPPATLPITDTGA